MNALCSWSGGKDSCFALMQSIESGFTPKALLNVLNEEGRISRSHGIPAEILKAQAASAGIPIYLIPSNWQEYEAKFTAALKLIRNEREVEFAVFGDIDLQAHRDWEEKVCATAQLKAVLPLWKQDRRDLVSKMLEAGIETMIVSCNELMGEHFLGKILNAELLDELAALGVDPCGENGEFHTLVVDCPLFEKRLMVNVTGKILHEKYWFCNLQQ